MFTKKPVVISLAMSMLLVAPQVSATTIQDDQQKLNALKGAHAQTGAEVNALGNQEVSLNDQIDVVTKHIAQYDQQVQQYSAQISDLENQISGVQQDIQTKQTDYQKKLQLLTERLKIMYEDGNASYLDVLMQSTDFSDFLDRFTLLSMIAKQDNTLLQEVKQMKQSLENAKTQLQTEQASLISNKTQLQQVQTEQEQARQAKQALLGQVQQQKQQKVVQYHTEEQEMAQVDAALTAAIQSHMQEIKREQEIAAQQATQKDQQPQQSSSYSAPSPSNSSNWTWPVPSSHVISSGYGPRDGGFHKGIDIAAPIGTPIVAVGDGTVLFAGPAEGFGDWIVIEHSNGVMSVYGHMYRNMMYVVVGQHVSKSQVIAGIGSNGESSGPHLHFGVALGITGSVMDYVNPTPYLQ